MAAGRRLFAFAPAWMWLFWLAGALVVAVGVRRGGEIEPRFLVATGSALEVWHGAERERTLLSYTDGSAITDLAVSEDGSKVAFVRLLPVTRDASGKDDFGADLYVANADGSDPRIVVRHGALSELFESPVWLPSGTEVAYAILTPDLELGTADQRVEAVDITTGKRRRLVDEARWPALMPGGRQLIVTSTEPDQTTGTEAPALYDLATSRTMPVPTYGARLIFINGFQSSPDGRQIAFAAATPGEDLPTTSQRGNAAVLHPILQDVWLMDPNGDNLRRLADLGLATPCIAWSDDGKWVYVMSVHGLLRINVASGRQEQLREDALGRMRLLPSHAKS